MSTLNEEAQISAVIDNFRDRILLFDLAVPTERNLSRHEIQQHRREEELKPKLEEGLTIVRQYSIGEYAKGRSTPAIRRKSVQEVITAVQGLLLRLLLTKHEHLIQHGSSIAAHQKLVSRIFEKTLPCLMATWFAGLHEISESIRTMIVYTFDRELWLGKQIALEAAEQDLGHIGQLLQSRTTSHTVSNENYNRFHAWIDLLSASGPVYFLFALLQTPFNHHRDVNSLTRAGWIVEYKHLQTLLGHEWLDSHDPLTLREQYGNQHVPPGLEQSHDRIQWNALDNIRRFETATRLFDAVARKYAGVVSTRVAGPSRGAASLQHNPFHPISRAQSDVARVWV
ncbi:hypothetical protein OIO90_000172 [Microbotryomycetes sp. JL221]|nr:hypothetical protein OIO90_000172 [Microbotryomycetes sp. JL221]